MPSDFVTKKDLREELAKLENRLENKLARNLEERLTRSLEERLTRSLEEKITRKLEATIIDMKDAILQAFDPIVKEIENNREDREIAASQTEEIKKQVFTHEQRISKLEQKYKVD